MKKNVKKLIKLEEEVYSDIFDNIKKLTDPQDIQKDLESLTSLDSMNVKVKVEKLKSNMDEKLDGISQLSSDLNVENLSSFIPFEGFPFFEVLCVLGVCSSSLFLYFLLRK